MPVKTAKTKTKTFEELAREYGICRRTFQEWRKKAKLVFPRGALTPKQVLLIYETFGDPRD